MSSHWLNDSLYDPSLALGVLNRSSLSFSDALFKAGKATAPAQIIGTYNTEDQTWLWAWANPSIAENLLSDALTVSQYGEEHNVGRLTQPEWVGTEDDAWAMVALAVKLCGKQGAYRGPAGATRVFIAFGEVKLSKA